MKVLLALLAALAVSAPAAAHRDASLTLDVTFFANQTIAVTLPDGAPVGTTSGVPTVIPAGYYTVSYTGPMGLAAGVPYFRLDGPGVDLLQNLNEDGTDAAADRERAANGVLALTPGRWTFAAGGRAVAVAVR
jgi:hypothetical protein